MFKSNLEDDLKKRFESKMQCGYNLLTSLDSLKSNVSGVTKLKKKIRQELTFLNKVLNSGLMKNEHLLSTNLHHFDALVSCIFNSTNVISVLETKSYRDENNLSKKLCVDIICENGRNWIKVIARNPKALSQILIGGGEFGQKSIVDHAVQYINCAKQNNYMFEQPQVYFFFASGVTKTLADSLSKMNINIIGNEIEEDLCEQINNFKLNTEFFSESDSDSLSDCDNCVCDSSADLLSKRPDITTINLDVSTMIVYVSALTNGGSNWIFREPLLNQQAEWERKRPVKPILDEIFSGKNLICCETAYKSFINIVEIIGGPNEKERTEKLLSHVKVVSDVPFSGLRLGGKIKSRSLVIFGTGYHHKALTATANEGFIRAAKHQGVDFAVVIHESRALTEIKQNNYLQPCS